MDNIVYVQIGIGLNVSEILLSLLPFVFPENLEFI